MTTDLWMLAYSAVLCLVIPYVGIVKLLILPGGAAWGFGNRDTSFAVPAWIERTRRAHANTVENLAPFACLVLVAHVAGKADTTTAFASQLFFIARVAYAGVYIAGIPYLRTLIFGAGIIAQFLIFLRILA